MNLYLYVTVFFCGAAVMVLEILGTRVIGPYYGLSHYVWTSLITVTLFALSLGYFGGGWLADRRPAAGGLCAIVALSGITTGLVPLAAVPVLEAVDPLGPVLGTLCSTVILFAFPLVLLGMVTPFALKLATRALQHLGVTAGRLYGVSTLGSIAGAAVSGFLLIPYLGVRGILYAQGALLLILAAGGWWRWTRRSALAAGTALLSALLLLGGLWPESPSSTPEPPKPAKEVTKKALPESSRVVHRRESPYGTLRVIDRGQGRWLLIGSSTHSVVDRERGISLFPYTHFLQALPRLRPRSRSALVVGLGAGSVPDAYREVGIEVEVVEIDPAIVEIARDYFDYERADEVILADGRHYLRHTQQRYDFIIMDAYGGGNRPLHLLSREVFEEARQRLTGRGILCINYLGFNGGPDSFAARSVMRTLRAVFPQVAVYSTARTEDRKSLANLIFLASTEPVEIDPRAVRLFPHAETERIVAEMLANRPDLERGGVLVTDDYNPLELHEVALAEAWRRSVHQSFPAEVLRP